MMDASDRRDESHLQGMILLSLLLHGIVLALVLFAPSFPTPKLTFGPVYTVSLVSAPANVLVQKPATRLPRELLPQETPEAVLKKMPDAAKAISIRPQETAKKKREKTSLEKAMAEIRRKAAAKDAAPPAATKAAGEKRETVAAISSAQGSGNSDLNAQMQAYYALIWSRIKGNWALPQGILPGEILETVIHVTILKSGAVTALGYEKRSGNRYFDESAMKAVQKASPFPPLSTRMGERSLDVGIRFHSSELPR